MAGLLATNSEGAEEVVHIGKNGEFAHRPGLAHGLLDLNDVARTDGFLVAEPVCQTNKRSFDRRIVDHGEKFGRQCLDAVGVVLKAKVEVVGVFRFVPFEHRVGVFSHRVLGTFKLIPYAGRLAGLAAYYCAMQEIFFAHRRLGPRSLQPSLLWSEK